MDLEARLAGLSQSEEAVRAIEAAAVSDRFKKTAQRRIGFA